MIRVYIRRKGLRTWTLQATFRIELDAVKYVYGMRSDYPDYEYRVVPPQLKFPRQLVLPRMGEVKVKEVRM